MSVTSYKRPHVDIFICIEMARERNRIIKKNNTRYTNGLKQGRSNNQNLQEQSITMTLVKYTLVAFFSSYFSMEPGHFYMLGF